MDADNDTSLNMRISECLKLIDAAFGERGIFTHGAVRAYFFS